ncbi:alanine racemase [Rhizobium sp.]
MDQILTKPTAFDIAPARLTIDTNAVVANWQTLAGLSGKAETAAVLKADAYGLGATEIGRILHHAGCRTFFVVTVDEGRALRRILPTARIIVLAGLWRGWERQIIEADLIPALSSQEQLSDFRAMGRSHPFVLNFDTGMNRMGFNVTEAAGLAEMAEKPVMVMSHLACADDRVHPLNARQRQSFEAVQRAFEGIESSLASSGAIFLGSDYHCDLTRPGIALYGGQPLSGETNAIRQVVRCEARILQIRDVKAGDFVSYGATHRLARDSRLAIVGAGYADGWQRSMSGSGVALRHAVEQGGSGTIAGEMVPVIGRVTMDLTIFDITDLPEGSVCPGDYVSLFGDGISLDDAAHAAGTISYELLTSLGKRYERRYL